MKAPGGTLSWKSGVSDAAAYGVNGTAELADAIQTVKGQNIYLVGVVSTCVDTLMAERYAATALQTASGSAYTDGSGGWVDPYNTFIRTYLVSLARNAALTLGFDEVAFSVPAAAARGHGAANMRLRAARPRARMRWCRWRSTCARI